VIGWHHSSKVYLNEKCMRAFLRSTVLLIMLHIKSPMTSTVSFKLRADLFRKDGTGGSISISPRPCSIPTGSLTGAFVSLITTRTEVVQSTCPLVFNTRYQLVLCKLNRKA
uniref:Uncharacterized protein n=1 Tax=Oncorhynchus tshawytscha TaxID=74940 RepID=A0A8C8D2G2_ONCTS